MTSFVAFGVPSYTDHNLGPSGQSIPAQVSQTAEGVFKADFVPRSVGEHRVSVTVKGQATAGSPYSAKVCMMRLCLANNCYIRVVCGPMAVELTNNMFR